MLSPTISTVSAFSLKRLQNSFCIPEFGLKPYPLSEPTTKSKKSKISADFKCAIAGKLPSFVATPSFKPLALNSIKSGFKGTAAIISADFATSFI